MNTALDQDLKEAIGKHLPQAAGELLQERLKQADADAATVVTQKERLDNLLGQVRELEAKLRTVNEELGKHKALDKREEEISARERNAEIAMLRVQLEAANTNTQFAKDVALGLVRNTEYRRSVFDSETTSTPIIPEGASYQSGTANGNSSRSTTDTTAAS